MANASNSPQMAGANKASSVKNMVKLNVAKSDIRTVRVVDTDIVITLTNGKKVVLRDAVVKAMMDPNFAIGFADGEITAQAALQQTGLVELNPTSISVVATPNDDIAGRNAAEGRANSNTLVASKSPGLDAPTESAHSNQFESSGATQAASEPWVGSGDVVREPEPESMKPTQVAAIPAVSGFPAAVGIIDKVPGFVSPAMSGAAMALAAVAKKSTTTGTTSVASVSDAVATVISGTITAGPIIEGNKLKVTLFKMDGTALGSSSVNAGGTFSVSLSDKTYSGAYVAVVSDEDSNPDFIDEATGKAKDLNATFMAADSISAGSSAKLNINAVTTVAAIKAGVPDTGMLGSATSAITTDKIKASNATVGRAFGLSDITTSEVSAILNVDGSSKQGNLYGKVLAAYSGIDQANGGDQKATINQFAADPMAGGSLKVENKKSLISGATGSGVNSQDIASAVSVDSSSATFDPAHPQNLTIDVASTLSKEKVQAISDLGSVPVDAFKALNLSYLSDPQLVGMSSVQVALITKSQWMHMTATQIGKFNATQVGALKGAQLLDLALAGKLDDLNHSIAFTTSQVNEVALAAGITGFTLDDNESALFGSMVHNTQNGTTATSSGAVTDDEKRIDTMAEVKSVLEVIHKIKQIAALDPNDANYQDQRDAIQLTSADLVKIGIDLLNSQQTTDFINALAAKNPLFITNINDIKSLVDQTRYLPDVMQFNDTAADDAFQAATGALVARGATGAKITYGIHAAADLADPYTVGNIAYNVKKMGTYGVLYVNSTSGKYVYVPDSAKINALKQGEAPSESFTMTMSDGTTINNQSLIVNLKGANDTPAISPPPAGLQYTDTANNATFVNAKGILQARDAEGAQLIFGIDQPTSAGQSFSDGGITYDIKKEGVFGTLYMVSSGVNKGNYLYVPYASVIKRLGTSDQPSETFVLTSSDGTTTKASAELKVNIQGANDAPTVSLTPVSTSYANDGKGQALFSNANVNTVDDGQLIQSLKLQIAGVDGSAKEIVRVDSSDIALTNGSSGTTTSGIVYLVTLDNQGNATLLLTSSPGMTADRVNGLINGMTYRYDASASSSTVGMNGDHSFTLAQITDSGSDHNTSTLSPTTTTTSLLDKTPPPAILAMSLSDDTGASDFVTQTQAQTIKATLSRSLATGETLHGSLDGANWVDLTSFLSGTSLNWTGVNLSATGTLQLKTVDKAGNATLSDKKDYALRTQFALTQVVDDAGVDTLPDSPEQGSQTKTDDLTPTFSGTLDGPLPTGYAVKLYDNGIDVGNADVVTTNGKTTWSYTFRPLQFASSHSVEARMVDASGATYLKQSDPYAFQVDSSISFVSAVDDNGSNTFKAPGTTYQYVYLRLDRATGNFFTLADLQVFSNGVNIAKGKAISTNMGQYNDTSESLVNLIDGNSGTGWTAGQANGTASKDQTSGWVQIDLGSQYQIDYTMLYGAMYDAARAQGVTLWLSKDDTVKNMDLNQLKDASAQSGSGVTQIIATETNSTPGVADSGGFSNDTARTGFLTVDDTTPTFSGSLSSGLANGYRIRIFDGETDITTSGGVVSYTPGSTSWSFTGAAAHFTLGSTHNLKARVYDNNNAFLAQTATNYAFQVVSQASITGAVDNVGTNTLSNPMAKYQYVYLRLDRSNATYLTLADLQVFSNGVNIAKGKAISTNMGQFNDTTEALANLIDGNSGTGWTAGQANGVASKEQTSGLVQIDLGSQYQIDYTMLYGAIYNAARAQGVTLWLSNSAFSGDNDKSLITLSKDSNTVQALGTTGAFLNTDKALTGYPTSVTDDTTPTYYGTLSVALTAGYTLRVMDNGVYIGDAKVTGTNWSFDYTRGLGSGSTHNITVGVFNSAGQQLSQSSSRRYDFKISPIVLDLNHDGYLSYSHLLMDVTGSGQISNVAWAGSSDGVLFWNKFNDGKVHDKSQYAFGNPSKGVSDLQGLSQDYDTNHDGEFSAADEKFGEFMVWQDKNSNGLSDEGETQSLAEVGITSIHLQSDGVASTPADGIEESGRTTAKLSNGQTMTVADATFTYTKATALQGSDGSKDNFKVQEGLSQIKNFNADEGDVLDLSGELAKWHAKGGNLSDYVQTVQRGNDTVIQVDATGSHDFAHPSCQVVLLNTVVSIDQLKQHGNVVL